MLIRIVPIVAVLLTVIALAHTYLWYPSAPKGLTGPGHERTGLF